MKKIIRNIHDLAEAFGTTASNLEATLSSIARTDITVAESPTSIRVETFVEECNTTICVVCKYPFEASAVNVFINSAGQLHNNMFDEAFDDPFDMLMNTTNPGEQWVLEDAGRCLSEAEACGWKFPNYVTPQFILDLYNDMSPEEGDE